MKYSLIITAAYEEKSISKTINSIQDSNNSVLSNTELLIVSPDNKTLEKAESVINEKLFAKVKYIKDAGQGKSAALNNGLRNVESKIVVLTDGDVYLGKNAIAYIVDPLDDNETVDFATGNKTRLLEGAETGATTAQVVSIDSKLTFFGYYSHVFCSAANKFREKKNKKNRFFPLSGYLLAFKLLPNFEFPIDLKAEDAFLAKYMTEFGYKLKYVPQAVVNVSFPKNLNDLINQKVRSLGGNVQVKKYFKKSSRNMFEDLTMFLFPLLYAKTPTEFLYSLLIYPLRFYLWFIIYKNHMFNNYELGPWKRIESSKI